MRPTNMGSTSIVTREILMIALLLIDLQFDFLPGGALAVPNGDLVLPVARSWMSQRSQFAQIVATQDWHPDNHLSFAAEHAGKLEGERILVDGVPQVLWPKHCVQGTRGAELVLANEPIEVTNGSTSSFDFIARKGMSREVDSYSGFFDNNRLVKTGLDVHLRGCGITRLVVMGLATDYCVKFTVLDALSLGYRVEVIEAGCQGVELAPGDSAAALKEMVKNGARLI